MNPNNTEEYRRLARRAIEEEYKNYSGNRRDHTLSLIGLGIAISVMVVYNNLNTDYKKIHNVKKIESTGFPKDSLEFKVKKDGLDFKVKK